MSIIDGLLVRPFTPGTSYVQMRDQSLENLGFAWFTRDSIYCSLRFRVQSFSQGDSLSHESIGIAHLCDTEEMASLVKARGASHGHRLRVSQPTAFHIDPPRFTLNIAGSPRPPPRRRGKKFELVGQHMRTLKESVSQNI